MRGQYIETYYRSSHPSTKGHLQREQLTSKILVRTAECIASSMGVHFSVCKFIPSQTEHKSEEVGKEFNFLRISPHPSGSGMDAYHQVLSEMKNEVTYRNHVKKISLT